MDEQIVKRLGFIKQYRLSKQRMNEGRKEDRQKDNGRMNEERILIGRKIRPPTSNGLRLTEYNQSQPQILKMEAPGIPT